MSRASLQTGLGFGGSQRHLVLQGAEWGAGKGGRAQAADRRRGEGQAEAAWLP